MRRLVLVVVVFAANVRADDDYDCGIPHLSTANRVVEGTPVRDGELPFLVYLYIDHPKYQKICTGSIISRRHILTAGHCAPEGANVSFLHGRMDWSNQALTPTKKFTQAPGFVYQEDEDAGSYLMPDLSIYEVDPMEFDEKTGKVCLPTAYKVEVGSKATVAGWGYNNEPNGMQNFTEVRPKVAEKNDVLLFEPEMCKVLGQVNLTFTICAGGHHTGTEGGDSGGPLVVNAKGRYFLIGTTAFGLPQKNADGEYQDVAAYMRVEKFCDWIEAATEKEAKCLDMYKAPSLST